MPKVIQSMRSGPWQACQGVWNENTKLDPVWFGGTVNVPRVIRQSLSLKTSKVFSSGSWAAAPGRDPPAKNKTARTPKNANTRPRR